jgi:hypothetical protein
MGSISIKLGKMYWLTILLWPVGKISTEIQNQSICLGEKILIVPKRRPKVYLAEIVILVKIIQEKIANCQFPSHYVNQVD